MLEAIENSTKQVIGLRPGSQNFTLSYTDHPSTPMDNHMFEIRKCNQN